MQTGLGHIHSTGHKSVNVIGRNIPENQEWLCADGLPSARWSDKTKERMKILFEEEPKLKEAYDIVNGLRSIFRSKLDKESARIRLHEWYDTATRCSLREIKSARDAIKSREDEVLNYFINHSTNAGAESLNSKIKSFRSQLRGVSDYNFFMYRLYKIFG